MGKDQEPNLTRRGVVVGLAATVAATAAATVTAAVTTSPFPDAEIAPRDPSALSRRPAHQVPVPRQAAGAEVRRFLGPVEPGFSLGGGWAVERIYDVHLGAVSLVLRNGNATAAVDMLRKSTSAIGAPIATSAHTALYLANRADGGEPTPEGTGLAMMSLAKVIEGQEHQGVRPPALLTLEERIASHSLKSWQVPA